MEEYDFDGMKKELRSIREKRAVLKEVAKNYKFVRSPILHLHYLITDGNFSRLKYLKGKVFEESSSLKKKYGELRKKYGKRYDVLNDSELFKKLEEKIPRLSDLEDRLYELKLMKEDLCFLQFGKKKQLNRVISNFENPEGEYFRRRRDMEELVNEIEVDRNISLEVFYTNKINSFEYSRN